MEFLSSPIHNYSFETFDDGFFELPKDLDFDMNDEFRDDVIFALDKEDDLNDGLYGVWNTRQPWNSNNNSASLLNSNLHLDFIGGDLESAIMVNPNVVIPNGSHFDEENESTSNKEINGDVSTYTNKCEEGVINDNFLTKLVVTDDETPLKMREDRNVYAASKENIMVTDISAKMYRPKTGGGLRVLKPTAVVEVPNNKTKVVWQLGASRNDNNVKLKGELIPINGYHRGSKFYPKPAFSYSCLIAMALKNSKQGCLPVAEIYNFMCNHFPYFKTAPNGWKNSVRHNLSLNKCFEKIEKPVGSIHRKGCLWALNPSKAAKLQDEVLKSAKKDAVAIKKAMEYPEHLELLERGELQCKFDMNEGLADDDEEVDTAEEDETEIEDPVKSDDENYDEESTKLGELKPIGLSKADGKLYDGAIDVVINDDKLFQNDVKKTRRYFTPVRTSPCATSTTIENTETEIDHYDINNYLKLENDAASKLGASRKTPPRFIKRLSSSTAKMKQIKFKSWD